MRACWPQRGDEGALCVSYLFRKVLEEEGVKEGGPHSLPPRDIQHLELRLLLGAALDGERGEPHEGGHHVRGGHIIHDHILDLAREVALDAVLQSRCRVAVHEGHQRHARELHRVHDCLPLVGPKVGGHQHYGVADLCARVRLSNALCVDEHACLRVTRTCCSVLQWWCTLPVR